MSLNYNRQRLWRAGHQNTQVFHWKELLEEWNDSLTMPPNIMTVIDNLKAASDPLSNHNPTINDFLRYFNWEQEGIKWFLYETIALRWMWGESRLDYVRDTIQEIDSLNSTFPKFPGSNSETTIRHFLDTHLNEAERVYLGLLEPTVAGNAEESDSEVDSAETRSVEGDISENFLPTLRTPPRTRSPSFLEPPPAPLRQVDTSNRPQVEVQSTLSPYPASTYYPNYPSISIHLIRHDLGKKHDDVITIGKYGRQNPSYSIKFEDKHSKIPLRSTAGLTRGQVLQYLSVVLRLMNIDNEPFEAVQLMIPHMPTVLLPYKMDSQTRELFYESIENTMDNWPLNA